MKRFLAVGLLLAATVSAVFVARADAILFGTPDGNEHPGVGYIVFYDKKNVPVWRCTGSLVSTRVLLTAGHCAGRYENSSGFHTPTSAQVWFSTEIPGGTYPSAGGVPCDGYAGWPCSGGDARGLPVPDQHYKGSVKHGVVNDIGVVFLSSAMSSRDVLPLAPVGTLDRTPRGSAVTIVGFGTQSLAPPPQDSRRRMRGTVTFLRTEDGSQPGDDPAFADFTNGAPSGAAACAGDSGGPVLNGDGAIVAEMSLVDPYVDGWCTGRAFHYRTDTADSARFLAGFGVIVPGAVSAGGAQHPGKLVGRSLNG